MGRDVSPAVDRRPNRDRRTARASPLRGRRILARACAHLRLAASTVGSTPYICWAAFAALYTFHGVRARVLPQKIFGVFQQQVTETTDPLTAGLGAAFPCPVSRNAEIEV